MGCDEQGKPAGKSGITSDQGTDGVVSCPDIRSASRLVIFSVFCLAGISLFIVAIDFPTVADRCAMRCWALEKMAGN